MRADVYHYFERACRRERTGRAEGQPGEKVVDDEGNSALFWLLVDRGSIRSADYRCTTCMALVGLCEHLREMVAGMPLERAAQMPAAELLRLHPEIPSYRRDRAELAVRALHSAVQEHVKGVCA